MLVGSRWSFKIIGWRFVVEVVLRHDREVGQDETLRLQLESKNEEERGRPDWNDGEILILFDLWRMQVGRIVLWGSDEESASRRIPKHRPRSAKGDTWKLPWSTRVSRHFSRRSVLLEYRGVLDGFLGH
jgi:hypothetical protein